MGVLSSFVVTGATLPKWAQIFTRSPSLHISPASGWLSVSGRLAVGRGALGVGAKVIGILGKTPSRPALAKASGAGEGGGGTTDNLPHNTNATESTSKQRQHFQSRSTKTRLLTRCAPNKLPSSMPKRGQARPRKSVNFCRELGFTSWGWLRSNCHDATPSRSGHVVSAPRGR